MNRRLLFRADGSLKIGFGHIYRVLALAELLNDKFQCFLVTSSNSNLIVAEAERLNLSVIKTHPFEYPFPNERRALEEIPFDMQHILEKDDIVVTDGYWFGKNYQKAIKDKGCRLICIDDLATGEFNADAIINHAPRIDPARYIVPPETALHLGLDYLILRPAFFKPRPNRTQMKRSVYLSFGGSDYYGLTLKFLKQCLALPVPISIKALLSSSFGKELVDQILLLQRAHPAVISLHQNLKGEEISSLIDTVTHAITASSTVALEVVARGVKPLIGYYSENQIGTYDGLLAEDLAFGAGDIQHKTEFNLSDYIEADTILTREFTNGKMLAIFESFS